MQDLAEPAAPQELRLEGETWREDTQEGVGEALSISGLAARSGCHPPPSGTAAQGTRLLQTAACTQAARQESSSPSREPTLGRSLPRFCF